MSGEITQLIDDFGGGLNTQIAPNRIGEKETPTCSDVWIDNGALIKRGGIFSSNSLGGPAGGKVVAHTSVNSQASISIYARQASTVLLTNQYVIARGNTASTSTSGVNITGQSGYDFMSYNSNFTGGNAGLMERSISGGTISVTSGSASITGSGTKFTTDLEVGDFLYFATSGGTAYLGRVGTITSDTSASLATGTWPTTVTNLSTWGAILSFPTSSRSPIVALNNSAYVFGQGRNGFYYANGATSVTKNTSAPLAAFGVMFQNYCFVANTSANPSRLFWSSILDPSTWPASNFVDVRPSDGQPIVGIFVDAYSLVIVKTSSVWVLSGNTFDPSNPTYTLFQVPTPDDFYVTSIGSLQKFNGNWILLGSNGFYKYSSGGVVRIDDLSHRIYPDIQDIHGMAVSTSLPLVEQEPSSLISNGSYILAVSSSLASTDNGYKNLIYVLDSSGAFWRWQPPYAGPLLSYKNNPYLWYSDPSATTPFAQPLNNTTADLFMDMAASGSPGAISSTWTSKVFEFKEQNQILYAYLYFKRTTPYYSPAGTVSTTAGSPTVTGSGTSFSQILFNGSTIVINGTSAVVSTEDSDTSLTLTSNFPSNNSGASYTVYGTYNIKFEYSIDGGAFSSITVPTDLTTLPVRAKSNLLTIGQVASSVQFRISNTVGTGPFTPNGVVAGNVAPQDFEVYGIEFVRRPLKL